jgi:hypothetical protein
MRRPELLCRLWVVSVVVWTVRGVAQKDCQGSGTGPLGGVVRVTEQELSTLTRPALVLFHSGEHGGVGSARQLWRDLDDWSRAEGIDVVVAASVRAGEAAGTHFDIKCLQQGSRASVPGNPRLCFILFCVALHETLLLHAQVTQMDSTGLRGY